MFYVIHLIFHILNHSFIIYSDIKLFHGDLEEKILKCPKTKLIKPIKLS